MDQNSNAEITIDTDSVSINPEYTYEQQTETISEEEVTVIEQNDN